MYTDLPLGGFVDIYAPQWTSARKTLEGLTTTDLFAFLTAEPNVTVATVNPEPLILTKRAAIETWLMAPREEARQLQRRLPTEPERWCRLGIGRRLGRGNSARKQRCPPRRTYLGCIAKPEQTFLNPVTYYGSEGLSILNAAFDRTLCSSARVRIEPLPLAACVLSLFSFS